MNQDQIEGATQLQRPHVSAEMRALGIDPLADPEHPRRAVGERELQAPLEVVGKAPGTGAELEQRARAEAA